MKLNDVRKHLRKWNGWDVDPDSQEHHELQEGIGSVSWNSQRRSKRGDFGIFISRLNTEKFQNFYFQAEILHFEWKSQKS